MVTWMNEKFDFWRIFLHFFRLASGAFVTTRYTADVE
jgi:hypothetical protein